jgi:two-component sensor histidine kinase
LLEHGLVTGVVLLVRDVSDLRQLNRVVLNKEAAVREVHHRVKNNLQTISSLLRLQARRSDELETRIALQEAERRVRSIAVVHEVLSREPGEEVVFDEIVRSLVLLVEDTVLALHPVEIVVNGELGTLSTDLATPLAVALAELLTNAVEHAFVDFGGASNEHVGVVTLNLYQIDGNAVAEIRDNGRGLRADFSLDVPTSLGLSIVRDLVRAQLHGTIEMNSVPLRRGRGYVRARRRADRGASLVHRGATASGQPLLSQFAALVLGGTAPDARLLVGGEGELQTCLLGVTIVTDALGGLDLVQSPCRSCRWGRRVRVRCHGTRRSSASRRHPRRGCGSRSTT